MTYTFWVEDETGKIAEYEINADSKAEALETVTRYTIEDGFYRPAISLM